MSPALLIGGSGTTEYQIKYGAAIRRMNMHGANRSSSTPQTTRTNAAGIIRATDVARNSRKRNKSHGCAPMSIRDRSVSAARGAEVSGWSRRHNYLSSTSFSCFKKFGVCFGLTVLAGSISVTPMPLVQVRQHHLAAGHRVNDSCNPGQQDIAVDTMILRSIRMGHNPDSNRTGCPFPD